MKRKRSVSSITSRTSNRHDRLRLLSSNEKNDVALRRVDIVVLEEERLVHAIFLQRRELDKQIQGPGKRLFKHEILLASDLGASAWTAGCAERITLHPRGAEVGPDALSR
jgi:hypothetical protein